MTCRELEPVVKDLTAKQPFNSERMAVTDPGKFLDSILPYMLKQKLITEEKENGKSSTGIENSISKEQT